MFGLSKQLNVTMESLYEMIVWPLQTEEVHAHDVFQRALLDYDNTISGLKLEPKFSDALRKELEKRYPLQQKKITAEFNLKCYSSEGVEDIKRALREAEALKDDKNNLKITLISSPRFIINAMSYDPKQGVKLVQDCLEKVRLAINKISKDSEFEIKENAKVLGYKDERELENMINEMNSCLLYTSPSPRD